jgi:formamidopyrimidine-DNA glycosylase
MPELPEVETLRRGLMPAMLGARVDQVTLRRPDIRFPFPSSFESRLTGRRIIDVSRRAKYLLFELDSGETLIAHLGMSGSFRTENEAAVSIPGEFVHERSKDPKHDHVVFTLDSGGVVTYNDPRRFGFMDLAASGALADHPRLKGLGVEPLSPEFDAHLLAKLFAGARTSLKAGLLDQRRIAGLGNIYACEALFRARLAPLRQAGILADARGGPTRAAAAIAEAIHNVLKEAIEAGGSTLRDHRQANGEFGYFQHVFKVYDREGLRCVREGCRGIVARTVHSGRSTFYCGICQR